MTAMQDAAPILISCLHANTQLCLALGKHMEDKHTRRIHFISDDCPSSSLLPEGSLILTAESHHPSAVETTLPNDANTLFDFIYTRDRFLKSRINRSTAMTLFKHWSQLIVDYLETHQIRIVILEGTPAYELLLEFWARKVGARIVCPAQIVWGSESVSVLYNESTWSNAYILKYSDNVLDKVPQPPNDDRIFDCNDDQPGLRKRFNNFIAHRSLNSPTRLAQVIELIRRSLSTTVLHLLNDDHHVTKLNGDAVSYFLHIDPEKSVDNSGNDVWPQLAVIKDLRERLPRTTTLLVREHPQIRGKRFLSNVRAIRNLPNTFYVSGQCDRMALIKQSRFVCTISGSVAGESAMKGAYVVVYGHPIFLHHPRVVHIESVIDITNFGRNGASIEEDNTIFARYINPRLAKFVFGDIHLMSSAMSNQNIANLANAILDAERLGWVI